jgi:hypothetical protein
MASLSQRGSLQSPLTSPSVTFLMQAPQPLCNNAMIYGGDTPLSRQKRKRTRYELLSFPLIYDLHLPGWQVCDRCGSIDEACSKEDEDILKAEYLRNPKPDKATRNKIVQRVAMGEKEVQARAKEPNTLQSASVNLY